MGKIIKGYWDCKYCRTEGISGGFRECPNCGKPRDRKTRFYMKANTDYVDEKTAQTISRNPDWICSFCNSLNSDLEKKCYSCGASKEDSFSNYLENKKREQDEEKLRHKVIEEENSGAYDLDMAHDSSITFDLNSNKEKDNKFRNFIKNNNKKLTVAAISIILLIITVFGMIELFSPKIEDITVDNISWERSIDVERYKIVEESGWTLPANARLRYQKSEIYEYEDVLDHYETKTRQVEKQRISHYETYVIGQRDLGNGYFEEITSERPVYETYYETEEYQEPVYRKEPVYRIKYYYDIEKWLFERKITTSGNDKKVYWGDVNNLKMDERTSTKHEVYYIEGKNANNEKKIISLSYSQWSDINIGEKYSIKILFDGRGEILG